MPGGRYLYLASREVQDRTAPVVEPTYSWRLIGANNRPIGRSAVGYADLASCMAVVQLISTLDLAGCLKLLVDVDTGLWNWRLHLGDQALALSARSYQRKRECVYSAESFAAIAATATVPVSLDEISLISPLRSGGRGPVPTQERLGSRIVERPARQPVLG